MNFPVALMHRNKVPVVAVPVPVSGNQPKMDGYDAFNSVAMFPTFD